MQTEIWQVEVKGKIYEGELAELEQWILDHALFPEDNVRRPGRAWIPAKQVPSLQKVFANQAKSKTSSESIPSPIGFAPPPPSFQPSEAAKTDTSTNSFQPKVLPSAGRDNFQTSFFPEACHFHPDEATSFVCRQCGKGFCRSCLKSYGTVRICPVCGEMCKPIAEFQANMKKNVRLIPVSHRDYGFRDFGQSWIYPFKFWQSLCLGALFVAVFSLGGLFGFLLSSMILFGCIAQTISQVAHGESDKNFMPDFDDFDLLGDVLQPVFLCVGVWLISLGPMLILIGILLYTGLTTLYSPPPTDLLMPEGKVKISQNPSNTGGLLQQQTSQIDIQEAQNSLISQLTDEEKIALIQGTDAEKLAINKKLNEQEAIIQSKILDKINQARPKTDYETIWALALRLMNSYFLLFLLLGLTIIWYFFYSPIALAIAGYTRSFTATINPLVGIDSIRRMGGTYLAACAFCQCIGIVNICLTSGVAALTYPFDLPFYGNIPARFITAITGFYLSIVMAFVLGSALHHTADKIGILSD